MFETIAEKLQRVWNAKKAIQLAIIDHGVQLPDSVPFEEYPLYIDMISGSTVVLNGITPSFAVLNASDTIELPENQSGLIEINDTLPVFVVGNRDYLDQTGGWLIYAALADVVDVPDVEQIVDTPTHMLPVLSWAGGYAGFGISFGGALADTAATETEQED